MVLLRSAICWTKQDKNFHIKLARGCYCLPFKSFVFFALGFQVCLFVPCRLSGTTRCSLSLRLVPECVSRLLFGTATVRNSRITYFSLTLCVLCLWIQLCCVWCVCKYIWKLELLEAVSYFWNFGKFVRWLHATCHAGVSQVASH